MSKSSVIANRAKALMQMQPGDILLTWDNSPVSRVIRFFTRKDAPWYIPPYSHCELCYQCATVGPDGVQNSPLNLSAEAGGVWPMPAMRYAAKVGKRVDVYRLHDMTPQQLEWVILWCKSMAIRRPRYDWLGVLHFAFKKVQHSMHKLFCSETVVLVLRRSTIKIWEGEKPESVTPRELGNALYTRKACSKVFSL